MRKKKVRIGKKTFKVLSGSGHVQENQIVRSNLGTFVRNYRVVQEEVVLDPEGRFTAYQFKYEKLDAER